MSVKLPWDPPVVRSCVLSGRCHTAGTEVSHRSPRRLEYLAFGPSWKCAGPRFRRPVPSAWDRVKHRKARVFLPLLSLRRCPSARRHALSFGACRGAPSSSRKLLETDFSPEDSRLLELGVPMSSSGCTWAPAPRAAGRTPRAEAGGVLAAGRGIAACQAQTRAALEPAPVPSAASRVEGGAQLRRAARPHRSGTRQTRKLVFLLRSRCSGRFPHAFTDADF